MIVRTGNGKGLVCIVLALAVMIVGVAVLVKNLGSDWGVTEFEDTYASSVDIGTTHLLDEVLVYAVYASDGEADSPQALYGLSCVPSADGGYMTISLVFDPSDRCYDDLLAFRDGARKDRVAVSGKAVCVAPMAQSAHAAVFTSLSDGYNQHLANGTVTTYGEWHFAYQPSDVSERNEVMLLVSAGLILLGTLLLVHGANNVSFPGRVKVSAPAKTATTSPAKPAPSAPPAKPISPAAPPKPTTAPKPTSAPAKPTPPPSVSPVASSTPAPSNTPAINADELQLQFTSTSGSADDSEKKPSIEDELQRIFKNL